MFFAECCDAALIDTFKIPTAIVAVLVVSDGDAVIALRFPTGMFLAGVYPPGLKIATGWFRDQRGLALGILIGALSAGKSVSAFAVPVLEPHRRADARCLRVALAGVLVLRDT